MLEKRTKTPFKTTPETPKLGWVGTLAAINLGLIVLLGLAMMSLAERTEFLVLTLLIVAASGGMVALLAMHIKKLMTTNSMASLHTQAYHEGFFPQYVFEDELIHPNRSAEAQCWWGHTLESLKKVLSPGVSLDSFERLLTLSRAYETGSETLELQGPTGKQWWKIYVTPFSRGALWTFRNISQKRQAEPYIQRLHTFFDHAPDGFISMNQEGDIVFCNETLAKWLGYTPNELIGMAFYKLLPEHARHGTQNPKKLSEITGFCEFLTSSQRVKSAYLEQSLIPQEGGFMTYAIVHLSSHQNLLTDMDKLLNITPIPVAFLDDSLLIREANTPFKKTYWAGHQSLKGIPFLNLLSEDSRNSVRDSLEAVLKGEVLSAPLEVEFSEPLELVASLYVARVAPSDDNPEGLFLQFHDITEQRKIETQLAQSQKMQAVGQLAGGVAHDFNNLLTAMIGFCDLLLQRHTPGDQSFTDIMQIKQNANRAANLVRQLLAFSRQQTLQPRVLNVTDALDELSALLRRLIGTNIDLKIKHVRNLGLVLVDQGQFEQVIINLAVNARDAIEGGGVITISTQNVELKRPKRRGKGTGIGMDTVPAGDYVLLEIEDSGKGIPPEILDRIFDPFFSTKEKGSGTGLGLSTVYGIVKQTGGFVLTESKLDKGTKFSIYLPRHEAPEEEIDLAKEVGTPKSLDLSGHHSILLVEDEDAVRLFSARALRSKGYTVHEASNGLEALEFIKKQKAPIDLVITDVVMPQMDGPTFVNEINQIHQDIKVLFISGYTEDSFRNRLKDDHNIQFLAKPFSLQDLAQHVKNILKNEPTLRLVA